MSKEGKIYLKRIRCFFPTFGSKERKYLKNMRTMLQEYMDENNNVSLRELYQEFGNPQDVVRDYYATDSVETLVKRIRTAKCIKSLIMLGVVIIICVASFKIIVLAEKISYHQENEITQYEETIY